MALVKPFSSVKDQDDLSVTQLLEVREYENGTVEKDYARTNIALDPAAANVKGIIQVNNPTSNSKYYSDIPGISVTCTLYYTARLNGTSIYASVVEYKVSKVVAQIVRTQVNSIKVTSAVMGYVLKQGLSKETRISYNNTAGTGGQTFTLNCTNTGWYPCGQPDFMSFYAEGLGGYVDVYASDNNFARIITLPYEA